MERALDAINDWVLWLVGGIAAGMTWVVRRVFTHSEEIALLKQGIDATNKNIDATNRRLDDQHSEAATARKELKESIDKLSDANIETLKYLRDHK